MFRSAMRVTGHFGCRCQSIRPCLRLQSPLSEPSSNAFGAGWTLEGLERLYSESGGVILDLGDDGRSLWFASGGRHCAYCKGEIWCFIFNYQGRFKSFPVQSDDQLLGLLRYVERNPLSAGLVDQRNCGGGAACGRERAARMRSKLCYRLGRWNGRRTGRLASTLH